MTVDEDSLAVVWKAEQFNLECGQPLLLNDHDLSDGCDAAILAMRVKEKVSESIEKLAGITKEQSSPSKQRDNCNDLLHSTLKWLKLIRSLNIFKLNSDLFTLLDSYVDAHVKFLSDFVYKTPLYDCLIDNEFLLMQNDLAQLLKMADYAPAIAPSIGKYYGYKFHLTPSY